MRHLHARAIPLALLLLLPLGCSDGTEPAPVPSSLQLSETSVSVADGESTRLTATVLDQKGQPLPSLPAGTAVSWSSADPAIASVTGGFVTGNRPGSTEVRAEVGTATATATVRVTQVPTRLERSGGDDQQAPAGEPLGDSLEVRVVDRHGSGVPNVSVSWQITTGTGSVVAGAQTSNAAGVVRAFWRLGGQPGRQQVTASAAGLGSPVVFSATAAAISEEDAPFITTVSPGTLLPGATATIVGGNFGSVATDVEVRIAGVATQVTAVSPQQLTVRVPSRASLPCTPSTQAEVAVTLAGYTAKRTHGLQVGARRTLAVGQMVVLTGADDLACNELAGGEYLVSTYNSARNLGSATVDFRGGTAAASNAAAPLVSRAPATTGARSTREAGATEHLRLLEANREILRRLAPEYRRQRGVSRSVAAARAPRVGEEMSFRVPKINTTSLCTSFDSVRARVVYAGPRAIAFEDLAAPLAGQMDSVYISAAREYEQSMHSVLTENFGDPLALGSELSNTEQVYMLFTKSVNDGSSSVAGFVFSGDLFTRAQCASSDRSAIFYARVPTSSATGYSGDTADRWLWTMRSTIIHEVKHIVSFAERLRRSTSATTNPFEESWLEESTARISEELWARSVFGYSHRQNVAYDQSAYCEVRPSVAQCAGKPYVMMKHMGGLYDYLLGGGSLTPLGSTGTGDSSFYGSGWSLVRWAIDNSSMSEAAFLRALVQDASVSGIANLEARAGRPWGEILPAWSLSLATAGTGTSLPAAGVAFPSWNLANMFTQMSADFPNSFGRAVPAFTPVGSGAFLREPASLRGGSAAVFQLSQSAQTRTIQLRGQGGNLLAETVGVAIVRTK